MIILNNPVYMNCKIYHASSPVTLIVSIFFVSWKKYLLLLRSEEGFDYPSSVLYHWFFFYEKLAYRCLSVCNNSLILFLFDLHLINFFSSHIKSSSSFDFNSFQFPTLHPFIYSVYLIFKKKNWSWLINRPMLIKCVILLEVIWSNKYLGTCQTVDFTVFISTSIELNLISL